MISRRTVVAGLAAMTVQAVAGCASRTPAPVSSASSMPLPSQDTMVTPPSGLDAVIDINHGSRVTDFGAIRRQSNILAVVHKASEGGDWFDPAYGSRRPQAEAAGLLWGAYHFGTAQYPGADQARTFLAAAQPGPSTLMVLDLEPNERHPSNTMGLTQAEDFVRTIYQRTGRLPLVYTNPTWANGGRYGRYRLSLGGAIAPGSILAECDLWVADYRSEPHLPTAWANRGWRLWQYAGDDGKGGGGPFGSLSRAVAGVDRCDRNMFGGDASTLYRYWTRGPDLV